METLGDMAYNATIGTAEDIKGAVIWGKDMVMDEEKREAFWDGTQENIQESGGFPNYLGEQAAFILGSAAISRAGIKGGSKLKPEFGSDGGSDKGNSAESAQTDDLKYAESGGRDISPEQFYREEAIAEEMYDKFRDLGTKDVEAIAKNTDFPLSRVQRIKDHVFSNLHIKDHGIGRFDPDYELAQAWERLMNGQHIDSDIQLLHHEIFESKFEGIFKTNYRTAHDKTIKSGRVWDWEKNYEE